MTQNVGKNYDINAEENMTRVYKLKSSMNKKSKMMAVRQINTTQNLWKIMITMQKRIGNVYKHIEKQYEQSRK